MKKVVVLGLAAALCVAFRVFGAEKSGVEEFRGGLDRKSGQCGEDRGVQGHRETLP
jgi:hypothetical protein